jgi:hypothetical protein
VLKDRDEEARIRADEVEERALNQYEEALDEEEVIEGYSGFDGLAKGLADGTFSRAQALKYTLASFLATIFGTGVLPLFSGEAFAKHKKHKKKLVCPTGAIKICKKKKRRHNGHVHKKTKCTCIAIAPTCNAPSNPCPTGQCCQGGTCAVCPSGVCTGSGTTQQCQTSPPPPTCPIPGQTSCPDSQCCLGGSCAACPTGQVCVGAFPQQTCLTACSASTPCASGSCCSTIVVAGQSVSVCIPCPNGTCAGTGTNQVCQIPCNTSSDCAASDCCIAIPNPPSGFKGICVGCPTGTQCNPTDLVCTGTKCTNGQTCSPPAVCEFASAGTGICVPPTGGETCSGTVCPEGAVCACPTDPICGGAPCTCRQQGNGPCFSIVCQVSSQNCPPDRTCVQLGNGSGTGVCLPIQL